jgi:two-component system sensor histidine kinase QseC
MTSSHHFLEHERRRYLFESIALPEVLQEATAQMQSLAAAHGVRLRCRQWAPCLVQARRTALLVLVKNLIRNAIAHSPPGAMVSITAYDFGFSVRDEGAGIARSDFAHLYKWFWQKNPGTGGAGIGLAVAQAIAGDHGWALQAFNAEPGAVFLCEIDTLRDTPRDTVHEPPRQSSELTARKRPGTFD